MSAVRQKEGSDSLTDTSVVVQKDPLPPAGAVYLPVGGQMAKVTAASILDSTRRQLT